MSKNQETAKIIDRMKFLSHYISEKQNVIIMMAKDRKVGFRTFYSEDKQMYLITIPDWLNFNPPGLDESNRYRVYRFGTYLESLHVKHSPTLVLEEKFNAYKLVLHIIEDRRIEDLGDQEFVGYRPERIFFNAYALSLRPNISFGGSQLSRQNARLEAFLQRLIIGKVNGWDDLPDEEKKLIERVTEYVEEKINPITRQNTNPEEVYDTLKEAADYVCCHLEIEEARESELPPLFTDKFSPQELEENKARYGAEIIKARLEKNLEEYEKNAIGGTRTESERAPVGLTSENIETVIKNSTKDISTYHEGARGVKEIPELEEAQITRVYAKAPPNPYLDREFIERTVSLLKGRKRIPSETAGVLSIPTYIHSKGKLPFLKSVRSSPKIRSILLILDFSLSMSSEEKKYKRALISTLEVLSRLGIRTGVFTFAKVGGREGFYAIKTLEEPKWTRSHAATLAALDAEYPTTPIPVIYAKLKKYIERNRPDITLTIIHGETIFSYSGIDPRDETKRLAEELKKNTRMVAFGIDTDPTLLAKRLKELGYHEVAVTSNMQDLRQKIIKLIAPTKLMF